MWRGMLRCDYVSSPSGIGIKTAQKWIARFKDVADDKRLERVVLAMNRQCKWDASNPIMRCISLLSMFLSKRRDSIRVFTSCSGGGGILPTPFSLVPNLGQSGAPDPAPFQTRSESH